MDKLEENLYQLFGYTSFREGQKEIIESILNGQDTLAMLPTGTGKSLCFQLPGMMMEGLVIIVSPLLALMQDQVEQMKAQGIKRVASLNSFLDKSERSGFTIYAIFEVFVYITRNASNGLYTFKNKQPKRGPVRNR